MRIKHNVNKPEINEHLVDGDMDALVVRVITPSDTARAVEIEHGLSREPVGVEIVVKTSFCDVKIATDKNVPIKDKTRIQLLFSLPSEDVTLRIW